MALFKILSNMDDTSKSLPSNYVKGYCYFDVRDGKFWVDTSNAASGRLGLNAIKADQLATARTIALTGDVTGSAAFDGSGNISITTVVADSSHNHAASNITSGTIAAARLPAATTSAQGAMTAAMVTKLNGIAEGANKYSLPTASSSTLGGVKIGTGIAISSGVISNSGVRSIATGTSNGTISVNTNGTTANVAVKGLGSNAYTSTGLVAAQASQPGTQYTLWIDTDEDSAEAMRADAIKYKTFSIATSAWSGSGPYTYSMTATGITANTAIINLTLDATSQTYQKAQLDWETGANIITLSTATKPTGTIAGYLIATDVTVI